MIRRILLGLVLIAMAVSMESCGVGPGGCCCADGRHWEPGERIRGSGNVIRVDLDVHGFTDVHLATIGTLYVELGEREGLVIEGEDNIVAHIETEIERGTLTITNRRNYNLHPTEPLEYYLTVRDLESIDLSSAGDAYLPDIETPRFSVGISSAGDLEAGLIRTGHLEVRISSSGDVGIESLEAEDLNVTISSSGSLTIEEGSVERQDARLSSAGSYRASRLVSKRADISVSSSGSAYVMVTEDLDARMSSSGSVYYSGNPRVKQHTSSSGRLRRLDV